jgi:hypothetical protein
MMEAASTSETLVNFYRLHGATTQKTVIFTQMFPMKQVITDTLFNDHLFPDIKIILKCWRWFHTSRRENLKSHILKCCLRTPYFLRDVKSPKFLESNWFVDMLCDDVLFPKKDVWRRTDSWEANDSLKCCLTNFCFLTGVDGLQLPEKQVLQWCVI